MLKKSGLMLAGATLTVLAACGGGNSGPAVTEDGWQILFDGSSLEQFVTLGDANWAVADDAVGADQSNGASFLVTNEDYTDFELELEFWVDTQANSGVFLRCQDRSAVADTSCYEVNIFDTRPDQTYRTGSIVNLAEPKEFVYTGGQWNRYQITVNGSRIQVVLNGHDMVDVEDSRFASGPVALQYGAGVVRFRNVRLRPL